MEKTTKPAIEWAWIETQWQRGVLSNVQIAKLHKEEFGRDVAESSIRLRASQYGWQRDISEAIRRETRSKLAEKLRQTANSPATVNAEEIEAEESRIVDVASDALVTIESDQRVKLAKTALLTDRMEAYAFSMLPVSDNGAPTLTYEPGELKDIISAASQSVASRARVIELERKVYGMDAPGHDTGSPSALAELRAFLNGN